MLDIFEDSTVDHKLINKGTYGKIKQAKEANPESWALKACMQVWVAQFKDNAQSLNDKRAEEEKARAEKKAREDEEKRIAMEKLKIETEEKNRQVKAKLPEVKAALEKALYTIEQAGYYDKYNKAADDFNSFRAEMEDTQAAVYSKTHVKGSTAKKAWYAAIDPNKIITYVKETSGKYLSGLYMSESKITVHVIYAEHSQYSRLEVKIDLTYDVLLGKTEKDIEDFLATELKKDFDTTLERLANSIADFKEHIDKAIKERQALDDERKSIADKMAKIQADVNAGKKQDQDFVNWVVEVMQHTIREANSE